MVRHYSKIAQVDVQQAHKRASPADNWLAVVQRDWMTEIHPTHRHRQKLTPRAKGNFLSHSFKFCNIH